MKFAFAIAVLFLSAIGADAGFINRELLWEGDFSTRAGAEKSGPEALKHFKLLAGPDGKGALVFKTKEVETDWIHIPLDAEKLRGLIQVEGVFSGRNLKQGKGRPFFGSKFMLNYRIGKQQFWPEADRRFGTYPWTSAAIVEKIPANATDLGLYLGIQGAPGEFRVASVKIHRCEEGDVPPGEKPPVNLDAAKIPRGPGRGTKYRGVMSGNDLSPEAFRTLGAWNVNLIRYQMNPGLNVKPKADISTPEKYLVWIDSEIKRLDELMPLLKQYGIKVIIDLHTGPGNHINAAASNEIDTGLNVDTLVEAWRRFATHYRGNKLIYGYDILNEPVNNRRMDIELWQRTSERVTAEIRRIDPETPVIIAAGFSISTFGDYKPLPYKNIIYTPHFYEPFAFTHQGVGGGRGVNWSYPGWINGVYWDKEQLRVSMKDAIEFQRKNHVPIFVGEFSAIAWAKGGDLYIRDVIELLEEYGWDWTYHAFREWGAWSVEFEAASPGKLTPSADNPRKRVLLEALKKNAK